MTLTYITLEYGPFRSQFDALDRKVQIEISKAILGLRRDPYCRDSKPLGWDLKGMRRIHIGPVTGVLYCVAYIICEECKDERLQDKFSCLDCFKCKWYHIKLISCGPRDEFYENLKKNWASWLRTIQWEEFTRGLE